MSEVNTTTRYQTNADTLQDAFAFVWTCIERGEIGDDPTIQIDPFWSMSADASAMDDDSFTRAFTVVVSGTITAGAAAPSPPADRKAAGDPSSPLTVVRDAHGDAAVVHFNGAFGIPHEIEPGEDFRTTVHGPAVTCPKCLELRGITGETL